MAKNAAKNANGHKLSLGSRFNIDFVVAFILVVLTVLARFLPHPPNFSPVLGLAFFSGSVFSHRRIGFFLPLVALLVSDLFLGYYEGMAFVYAAYILATGLGKFLTTHSGVGLGLHRILPLGHLAGVGAVLSALAFFILSNFGVWLYSGLYEKSASGLVDCFVMALPFFPNTLISTVLTVALLLGVYARIVPHVLSHRVGVKVEGT